MTAKQVAGLAERRIRQIQALPEHPRRAALANLRRGVGRALPRARGGDPRSANPVVVDGHSSPHTRG